MAIKLKLQGFDELLQDIETANGSITKACESAMRQSAQTMQTELKTEMRNATPSLSARLADRMPPFEVKTEGNRVEASVGFKSAPYNPNDLSDYHKAIFANYGTPTRSKHGKERARGFIEKAKKNANKKIKKQQKQALNKILERLKK